MSIRKLIRYYVFCNKCGETLRTAVDDEAIVFKSSNDAKVIAEFDGWVFKGRTAYCPKCRREKEGGS